MWMTSFFDSLPLLAGEDVSPAAMSLAIALALETPSELRPTRVRMRDILAALREGNALFRTTARISTAYAAVFVTIGLLLFLALDRAAIAPLSLSAAGGFMLIGPALLAGFFAVADCREQGAKPRASHIWRGFRDLPRGGWAVSFVCALLLLIWLTDAGTLYGFMVGQTPHGFRHLIWIDESVTRFIAFSSLMGAGLAFILFTVSAFSIPLIYYRRANLVSGVVASVRAVFGSFPVVICWAVLLAAVIIVSAWLLPLLLYTLPVMAFASRAFYQRVFPPG